MSKVQCPKSKVNRNPLPQTITLISYAEEANVMIIAEGFERGGDKEFLQFLAVALLLRDPVARFAPNSTLLQIKGTYRRPCLLH